MWPLPQAVPEPLKNGEGGEHHTAVLLSPRQAQCHCWDVFSFVFIYRELATLCYFNKTDECWKQLPSVNPCAVPVQAVGQGNSGPSAAAAHTGLLQAAVHELLWMAFLFPWTQSEALHEVSGCVF